MRHGFSATVRSSRLLPLGAAALGLLTGCADSGSGDGGPAASPILTEPAPLPQKNVVIGEFIAHLSPKKGTIAFERVERAAPGPETMSIDELNIVQDEIPNNGPPTTVELTTNSVGSNSECPAGYQTNTFCGNVTLRHFYSRSLANVFVQATSITPPTGHNGLNSDSSEFGLDDTYGLWKYTSPSAAVPGVLGQAPFNEATRDWVFADPDGADTSIVLRVVASLKYAGYTFDFGSSPFIDACSGGASTTVASAQQTMPFPFTLYGSTNTIVRYNRRGMITFGSVTGSASGTNVALPNTGAPKPMISVFWDNIVYGAGGSMCYKVVGSAPNRQVVITWNNMNFADAADQTATLQFGAILTEGTNNIEVVYNTMTGPTSRADGAGATVGVQNEAGTAATSETDQPNYGAGNSYAFVPNP